MLKNVSGQRIGAQLITAADGTAFTGSVTVAVTVDAGTQATGSVGSGACTHEGNGYHTYAPAQAETNGDLVAFTFTGTGAVPVTVQVYTLPATGILAPATAGRTLVVDAAGLADANMVKVGPTGSGTAQTARDLGLALPAAAPGAAGGLPISAAGGLDLDARLDAAITTRAVAGDAMALTSGERTTLAGVIWNSLTSGMSTVGSIGKKLADWAVGILDAAYDAAKTAAQPGDEMDLVDAPNPTALDAMSANNEAFIFDEGDATALLAAIAAKVEEFLINDGDSTATLAAMGAAVRAELTTELARIDAAITTRMASYTQPTGFLAATFPGTLASTTNITAAAGVALTSDYDAAKTAATQASVDDVPNNAEFAAALAAADDAVLAAIAALENISVADVWTTALTEAYRATGATGTAAQLLYELLAHLSNMDIAGAVKTTYKLDGTTQAKQYTLDDATTPTAIAETA